MLHFSKSELCEAYWSVIKYIEFEVLFLLVAPTVVYVASNDKTISEEQVVKYVDGRDHSLIWDTVLLLNLPGGI
jgi:hypothetical protein